MTLLVGMDEAGYGPNLGPLVVTATAWRIEGDGNCCDLWERLQSAVRRCGGQANGDDRLVIDDSKLVYSGKRGRQNLERGVLSCWLASAAAERAHAPGRKLLPITLEQLCWSLGAELADDSHPLPWEGDSKPLLPRHDDPANVEANAQQLRHALKLEDIELLGTESRVLLPARFNAMLASEGSKATLLSRVGVGLLREVVDRFPESEAVAVADKHGGRNYYHGLLQHAFPEFLVLRLHEGREQSHYRVRHGEGTIAVRFQKAADREHLPVALASMVSKYLRELLMEQFNRFWLRRIDGLHATAGYPSDASRFWAAIAPLADELGIAKSAIWRQR